MTQLQTTWGWLVAVYLFLGGLGAGAFVMVGIVSLATRERFKSTVRFGAWVSAIAIAVGTLFLLLDAGRPFRALLLWRSFVNFRSWMTIGAWLLFGAILLNGLFALSWTERVLGWARKVWQPLAERRRIYQVALAGIGILVNLGVAVYTGILIGVLPFRPLWHTWLVPALFTASALCTGSVVVVAYAMGRERLDGGRRLIEAVGIFHVVMICVEVGFWVAFLLTALRGSADASRSVRILTEGALAPLFWVVVVGMGLAVPFVVHTLRLTRIVKRARTALVLHAFAIPSVLIGAFIMRWAVLSAGLPQMLASPALNDILRGGVTFLP